MYATHPLPRMDTVARSSILSPTLIRTYGDSSTADPSSFMEPSSLLNAQDYLLSGSASHTPLLKQFIPVVILAAFLLLLFVSHILRYPRILYGVPHIQRRTCEDDSHRQRRRMYSARSATLVSVSLPTSLSRSITSPHDTGIKYPKPTVRLVGGHDDRSPELLGYLPEEITLQHSSPTLVGSSSSEISVSTPEVHGVPSYLPLAFPKRIYHSAVSLGQDEDTPSIQGKGGMVSTGAHVIGMISDTQPHPTLSSSPTAPALPALYNIHNVSDAYIPPLSPRFEFIGSATHSFELPINNCSHVTLPLEPSPPPLALAQPVLVRRALFPWRRPSSMDSPYKFIQPATASSTADLTKRHRPSVPSRLRHFITRSASVSLSSSHTHSTGESSLGKRSERSPKPTTLSPGHKWGNASSVSEFDPHTAGRPLPVSVVTTLPRPCPGVKTVHTNENSAQRDEESKLVSDIIPEAFEAGYLGKHETSFLEPPSPPRSSLESAEARSQLRIDEEELEETKANRLSIPVNSSREAHRPIAGHCTPLELGLRMSDPVPVSRSASVLRSNMSSGMLWTDGQQEQYEGGDRTHFKDCTSLNLDPRTILLSRWIKRRELEESQDVFEEENKTFGGESHVTDESVEVMIMNRWAGLAGV